MKKNIKKIIFPACLVILIMQNGNLFSQDWPQWRGVNRDAVVTGFNAPSKWPAELNLAWKIQVGTGDATPVLAGKKLYLNTRQGNNEVILCLDAETGKELWKNEYPAQAVTGPAASHPGPRSTPAVSEGKLVTFGATGILSCLNAGTGKLLWRKENPANAYPQFFTGMSPLMVSNAVIVHTGSKDNGEVVCYDLKTGDEKWKWKGDGPAYASPAVMADRNRKMIIVQTEKNIIALDNNDGKLLWQISTPTMQRFYNCVSPYIDGTTLYFTGQGSGTRAVKATSSGTAEQWTNKEVGARWNTPVLKEGYLYGFTDQKRIYCINASTGQTSWIDNTVNSDFATIVDCGPVIMGLPSTGNLLVFRPDPSGYNEIAKYKVAETPVYSFPVVAGNRIYIKDAESLMMYEIGTRQ